MQALVVDSSVLVALALQEAGKERLAAVQDWMEREGAHAPAFWSAEVVNSVMSHVRDGTLPQDEVKGVLMDIDAFRIKGHLTAGESVMRLHALAEKHGLVAYDACYLETALRLGAVLATLDKKLALAAEREGLLLLPRDVV